MPEIKEVIEDVRDKVGDKWFIAIILVVVVFAIYNYFKGSNTSSSSDNELVTVTTVGSYPDTVTNADVIISTLQDSIDYSEGAIIDEINSRFEATNDYINQGLKSAEDINDKVSGLTDTVNTVENVASATYYELMLHQGRDGYIDYNPERALSVLSNMGVDTSTENGTDVNGNLTGVAGSQGGGHTTFTKS